MTSYEWLPQVCPICDVEPGQLLGYRGGSAHRSGLGIKCSVWRCRQCGLILPNPMPVPTGGLHQHYAVEADDYFRHHEQEGKTAAAQRLLDQAESLIGGRGRILDIGSGRGELLRAAKLGGWDALGIEPSSTFAKYASAYSGARVIQEPIEKCSLSTGSFDVVILAAVLEHLYTPDETLRQIARVLRPGGVLFVDVPNEEGLYFRLGNLYYKLRGRDWVTNLAPTFEPFHTFGFGSRSLRAALSKHSLKPVKWHVYAGRSFVPGTDQVVGNFERLAAAAITSVSRFGQMGTYIEAWARRA